ncbi:MAG: NAD-dependent epimerase/dehydratase family protein, partial [Candidatus Nanopelagicales bacterium]|nr:NAD-dependent epimerase/dehydratase family protein [Candidatus Nanopelagicales bacterium]
MSLGPGSTIAITGASGLIGSALSASLTADGVRVIRMVRRGRESRESALADTIAWDPGREW